MRMSCVMIAVVHMRGLWILSLGCGRGFKVIPSSVRVCQLKFLLWISHLKLFRTSYPSTPSHSHLPAMPTAPGVPTVLGPVPPPPPPSMIFGGDAAVDPDSGVTMARTLNHEAVGRDGFVRPRVGMNRHAVSFPTITMRRAIMPAEMILFLDLKAHGLPIPGRLRNDDTMAEWMRSMMGPAFWPIGSSTVIRSLAPGYIANPGLGNWPRNHPVYFAFASEIGNMPENSKLGRAAVVKFIRAAQ